MLTYKNSNSINVVLLTSAITQQAQLQENVCKFVKLLNIVQSIEIELELFTNTNANVAFDVD